MSDQLEILPPESRDAIALTIPNADTLRVLADIEAKRESFAKWIEAQISNL